MKLPTKLRSPKKGLINIKNEHQKSFIWFYVRDINPVKVHPERITREDKKNLLKMLIIMEVNFLCKKKILARLKQETTFGLTCLVREMG